MFYISKILSRPPLWMIGRYCVALLVVMASLLGASSAKAQMTVPTITSEESRCQATGKVIINGNVTYLYFLTGNQIPQLGPKSGTGVTFDLLPPGSYTVTQIEPNSGEEASFPITVTGNYQQNWFFSAQSLFAPCSNGTPSVSIGNLQITDANNSEQRPDYFFRISAKNGSLPADGLAPPDYTTPLNGSFSIPFPDGTGGTYEIQGKDACGNYKTLTVSVPSAAPGPNVNNNFVKFSNCDGDANYKISASGGTAPYIFTIKSGPDQVGTTSTGADATFTFKAGGSYTVEAMDQCGGKSETNLTVKPYVAPDAVIWSGLGKCGADGVGTGSIKVNVDLNTVSVGPVTVSLTSAAGCSQPAPQNYPTDGSINEISFDDLVRPCKYTVTITDGCGKTTTDEIEMVGPGVGKLQCYQSLECPDDDKTDYKLKIGIFGIQYNPTPPFKVEVIDSTTNANITGFPIFLNGLEEIRPSLPRGKYYIKITDACGATCLDSSFVPRYERPTVSVDGSNKCAGSGQANVIGINNREPLFGFGDTYLYKIESGPTRVGQGPESDSPFRTGQFSGLESGGTYTFSFNDGCKIVTTQITIPGYQQPTWEVGFGAICPPRTKADLQIVNLQPEGKVVGPYTWRIISTDSPLYNSAAPYNGTLPYPNSLGQTDSTFANLPPMDANGSAATYNIQGSDGCKNSFTGSGKIGVLPDPSIILSKNVVCPDGQGVIRARPSIPVVGATYIYFRDGVEVARSKRLFTTISPALPGSYTVKVYPLFETDPSCVKESSSPGIVTASGTLVLAKDSLTCTKRSVDLVALTAGSSAGAISYFSDRNRTVPVPNPNSVTQAGTYYVQLLPDGVANCKIVDSLVLKDNCKPLGAIGNFVFVDANKDGKQDAGEAGVDGVTVNLLNASGAVIGTTTTAGGGKYLFENLPAGTYSVEFVKTTIPAIYSGFTAKDTAGVSEALNSDADLITGKTEQVTLNPVLNPTTAADSAATFNFTLDAGVLPKTALGAIGNFVFVDVNKDGKQDAGEAGVDGVTVNLLNASGAVIGTTTTAGGGKYLFENLPAGTYSVEFVKTTIPAIYSGFTAKDTAGVSEALNSDADLITGKTEQVTLAPVLNPTTAADSAATFNFTLDAGVLPKTALGAIGNFVFVDVNKDGKQDAGEAGVDGVTVNLLNSTGAVIGTTTTAGGGKYLFPNLPAGTYSVEFVKSTVPAIYSGFTAKDTAGVSEALNSDADLITGKTEQVTLNPVLNPTTAADSAATFNFTLDAGVLPKTALGAIGNFVFVDVNKDGKQDTGEAGVDGVTVNLLNASGAVIGTTTTAGGGKYLFPNLPAGTYSVEFVKTTIPAIYSGFTAKDTAGVSEALNSDADLITGKTEQVTLAPVLNPTTAADSAATFNFTLDAGVLPKTALGAIGNFVFVDVNKDGKQDAGEAGVDGVTVNLLNASGAVIGTTTTAGGGKYLFPNLPAGTYSVEFVKSTVPAIYSGFTAKDTAGVSEALNSDADLITGKTEQVTLAPVLNPTTAADSAATFNFTLDAGVILKPTCVKPKLTLIESACATDKATYVISFSLAPNAGVVKVSSGTLSGSNPYTVTGIASGVNLKITDSLGVACVFDTTIIGPNCGCPPKNPVAIAPSKTICQGEPIPDLEVTVSTGETTDWYATQTGGTALATGTLKYKPTGEGTFWVEARNIQGECTSTTRTPVTLTINDPKCIPFVVTRKRK